MPGSRHARRTAISEDSWMRWTALAAARLALAAALLATALLATACSGTVPAAASRAAHDTTTAAPSTIQQSATAQGCYKFAVTALRHRVVVRHIPPACAGLGAQQVNLVIARAIRTVVGPLHKAAARREAAADSRYLGSLIRPVRVPPAAAVSAGSRTTSATLSLRLAALAAWVAAATAGAYLLAGLLAGNGRRRRLRIAAMPPWVILGHAGLAVAGLCIWIAYTITSATALAWTDVGLTWVIAGLGMATLLAAIPEQRDSGSVQAAAEATGSGTAPFPSRAPVITIALHGALATLTILLVLLAAVGAG
jgi:manganese efflux pump family protein